MSNRNGPDATRRALIIGATMATVTTAMPGLSAAGAQARFAYVGCRTTRERNARGEGLAVYRIDPAGAWSRTQLVDGLVNPSFICFDREERFLYVVHGDFSEISSFGIAPDTRALTFLGRVSTEGRNPVHLVPDRDNRFIIVANYATGTLAVLPRQPDGSLGKVSQLETLPGEPGPHRTEQAASHPHHLVWDPSGRVLFVPDKGVDRIFAFRFEPEAGRLVPAGSAFLQVRPGAGPRHIAFHPTRPFAYVAQELDSSVGAFGLDAGAGLLRPFQALPSIPDTFTGANTAAEIEVHPSGRFLFVSNRGHDSVAAYAVDQDSGRLSPIGWTPSEGKGPRFFALDPSGDRLYVANENSDTIVPYAVDPRNGQLRHEGEAVRTGSPVCIAFPTH